MTDRLFGTPESLFAEMASDDAKHQEEVVAAAREDLKKRLPELRKLPGFPHGSDEDILAMSYPPYYTACPNPFIADWLTGLTRPGDEGRTDPGPFASDVKEGKSNAFYRAHSYPTKVPHPAIMRFILHYTKPGDVVLDGFAGSGMTGVAAQACGNPDTETRVTIEQELGSGKVEWGRRRAILADLGPTASFVAAGLNLPVDADKFDRASEALLDRFDSTYGWMYKTEVTPEDGEPFEADIDYVVWSEVFTCPHCGAEVVYFEEAFEEHKGKLRSSFACGTCGADVTKNDLERRKSKVSTLLGDTVERVTYRPVRIFWRHRKLKGSKRVESADIELLDRIGSVHPQAWFPTDRLPIETMVHGSRLAPKGFTHIHHLWSTRPLLALQVLWEWSGEERDPLVRLALRFWVEQAFWGMSWMVVYSARVFSMVNQYRKGLYYISSMPGECSPRYYLGARRSAVLAALKSERSLGECMISTGSSTRLPVPDGSVDYIFVDPPFGQNIPYSDLAIVIEAWHRVITASDEEATEDPFKKRDLDAYADLMARCFTEFYRVLKPGRWMTVEFSNHSNDVWLRIQNALAAAGFVVADTRIIDKELLSFRQVTSVNAVKHDLVISAYKPAEATERSFEIAAGSPDGAWAFVREHLSRIPATEGVKGQALVMRERQADRIYERMVGYHVARNTLVPMTAAEFYAGLEQRLPVRDGMYFLPGQVEEYERFRITFKELAAQELFIRDESTAVQWLRQVLKVRPRAFADIQPLFMREMQSSVASWEAMPDLREMLEANFVTDERGRWSVPDPRKSGHLDQLRTRALLKEYESYKEGRGPLARFRTEAVRAGFKAAWAAKDFATIVAVGRRLPSDVFVEDSALLHYFRNAERLAP
jgi:hypothetical protein